MMSFGVCNSLAPYINFVNVGGSPIKDEVLHKRQFAGNMQSDIRIIAPKRTNKLIYLLVGPLRDFNEFWDF